MTLSCVLCPVLLTTISILDSWYCTAAAAAAAHATLDYPHFHHLSKSSITYTQSFTPYQLHRQVTPFYPSSLLQLDRQVRYSKLWTSFNTYLFHRPIDFHRFDFIL